MKALSLREGIIAVEDNKLDAINLLEERLAGSKLIKVQVLRTKYPQGDERQLIYALTGRELPTGKLPADIGCCVFNAETCAAVFSAFAGGMPLIERIVTVDGDCVRNPKNLLVPLGTSYSELIDYCGGLTKTPKKIINGGPMMGIAQWDKDGVVTKGTSAILVFSEDVENKTDLKPGCIRCGRCVRACPMRLMPSYLAMFSSEGKLEMAEQFDVMKLHRVRQLLLQLPGTRSDRAVYTRGEGPDKRQKTRRCRRSLAEPDKLSERTVKGHEQSDVRKQGRKADRKNAGQ